MKTNVKVGVDQLIFTFILCTMLPVLGWIFIAFAYGKSEGEGNGISISEWAVLVIPIILWCYRIIQMTVRNY